MPDNIARATAAAPRAGWPERRPTGSCLAALETGQRLRHLERRVGFRAAGRDRVVDPFDAVSNGRQRRRQVQRGQDAARVPAVGGRAALDALAGRRADAACNAG